MGPPQKIKHLGKEAFFQSIKYTLVVNISIAFITKYDMN